MFISVGGIGLDHLIASSAAPLRDNRGKDAGLKPEAIVNATEGW